MERIHQEIQVTLSGLAPLCFDKFFDHKSEKIDPDKKFYYGSDNELVIPTDNIESFLFAEDKGTVKKYEGKKWQEAADWGKGHVRINADAPIPILDNGTKTYFTNFENGKFSILLKPTRTGTSTKRVTQEARPRPVIALPWELQFSMTVIENPAVTPAKLLEWFEYGGLVTGLCNYRPKYGRFQVTKWEPKE